MRKKIYVTVAEMLELREQGLSNHDIAKSLDISYATVLRYIGKQNGHMEGLEAFKDAKPRKEEQEEAVKPMIPKYEPNANKEWFAVCDNDIVMDYQKRVVVFLGKTEPGYSYGRSAYATILVPFDAIPDIVQFLAWAMRERMEVVSDAEQVRESEGDSERGGI